MGKTGDVVLMALVSKNRIAIPVGPTPVVSPQDRWLAEIYYSNARQPSVRKFEELYELYELVELGPDWNLIDKIVVTLNRKD